MIFKEMLIQFLAQLSWQEWVSFIFQVLSVWFARKNNILVYPTGIIGVLLAAYAYILISKPPIYADGILQIYYFVMSIYGWIIWTKKDETAKQLKISFCTRKELLIGAAIWVSTWLIIYILLQQFSNSDTKFLDSLSSSLALTAMWWMANKKVENWWAWVASNCIAIPLNFYKGFVLFAFMYLIFIVLAIMGGITWRKIALQK